METIADTMLGMLFFAWFATWFIMVAGAAAFLSRHDRTLTGFFWGLLFGPLGLLMAFLKAENLDREEHDKAARAADRHALATREQDITRAIVTALAADRAAREPRPLTPVPPTVVPLSSNQPPTTPRGRSYEEIMASDPETPPRRFR